MPKNWKREDRPLEQSFADERQKTSSTTGQNGFFDTASRVLGSSKNSPESEIDRDADSFETRMENFVALKPKRKMRDLIVSDVTQGQINALLAKIQYQDVLYDEWGLDQIDIYGRKTAINLYGPPGTGKTFCAEAIADELGKKFIKVNYAEIESKYVGDTPKNITAAFAKAKQEDAILFFDEADSILGKRLTSVTQSSDHGVNVSRSTMLLQLDEFQGISIFATNLASNYDGAFVRRIVGHIEMPLPDEECRVRLWRHHMPSKMPVEDAVEPVSLAEKSNGLSGGDILNAVILAASDAVQRTGSSRVVNVEDFDRAISSIRKAKSEVGGQNAVSTESIPIEDAPESVQEALREIDTNDT